MSTQTGPPRALLKGMTNTRNSDYVIVTHGEIDYEVDVDGHVQMVRWEYVARINDYTNAHTLNETDLAEVRAIAAKGGN